MGSCGWGAGPAASNAEVIINRDGSVIVRTGTQEIGAGMRTIAGILVADRLGIPLANIDVQIENLRAQMRNGDNNRGSGGRGRRGG